MSEERKKIVGVNLGNWLVLEKWMQPFLFEENCAEDEVWLNRKVPAKKLRPLMKKHRDIFIREVFRWIESDQPYTIRFGISMLMRHYLDEGFKPEYPEKVAAIRSEEYYVNMMRAWYFATALAKQYEKILPFLEEQRMDIWTHNKTIQKSIESYRITQEQKDHLRTLRIKK